MQSKPWIGNQTEGISPAAWPFVLLVVIGLLLPSTGGHGFLNPKSLGIFPAALCTGLHMLSRPYWNIRQILVGLTALALFLLLFWSLLCFAAEHPGYTLSSALDQFKVFAITILTASMLTYWYSVGGLPFPNLLRALLIANLAFSLAKIGVLIALLLHWIDIMAVLKWGLATMTTGMGGGLMRLQLSTDIPTPYLLFFALMTPRLGVRLPRGFMWLYVPVSLLAIFTSYSRYLWAVAFGGFILAMAATATPMRLLRSFLVLATAAAAVVGWLGWENVEHLVVKRFLSEETHVSDEARVLQTEALVSAFEEHPWLGTGLGSWTEESIRDRSNPHHYEVQWLAFLMQFGFFGFLLLIGASGAIAIAFWRPPMTVDKLVFLLMYGLWMLSGLTNPFMISLNSGTLYGLFLVTAWRLGNGRICWQKSNTLLPSS